jgi:hypothetical protein
LDQLLDKVANSQQPLQLVKILVATPLKAQVLWPLVSQLDLMLKASTEWPLVLLLQ